ncbi:hypothetical protein GZ77_14520 [Endozoicomonas montiporae]|uniref:Uncharacterized protein n=4 Tax=Endozoicomonas montiporae TaxID=1027273 RepID=A0A081N517_9GAMM|nr:hypothetical protein EZMO1_3606 [Endozoicomonas montiporae CL-33]KEQ13540.1 hypothetical protein GZ77_14520 [Endozoicomonas montiporae]
MILVLVSISSVAKMDVTWFYSKKGVIEKKVITQYDEDKRPFAYSLPESRQGHSTDMVEEVVAGFSEGPDLMQYFPRDSMFLAGSIEHSIPVEDYESANFRFRLFPIGFLPGFSSSYRSLRVEHIGTLHNTVVAYLRAERQPTVRLSEFERNEIILETKAAGTQAAESSSTEIEPAEPGSAELESVVSNYYLREFRDQTVSESDIPESTCTVVVNYQHGLYRIFIIRGFANASQIQNIIYLATLGRTYRGRTYYQASVYVDAFHSMLRLDPERGWLDEPDAD